jgi:hypothetical protein
LLSIIVPARNGAADTSVCLASIGHSLATLQLDCEIVLIDDASDPAERLTELFLQHQSAAPRHEFIIARSRRHCITPAWSRSGCTWRAAIMSCSSATTW